MMRIRQRRGTAAEWTASNPILGVGELGVETDTRQLKAGDGASHWNVLGYVAATVTDDALAASTDGRYPRTTNLTSFGANAAGADVDARPALDAVLLEAVTNGMGVGWLPMGRYRLKTTYNPSDQSVDHPARVLPGNLRGFTWLGGWGKIAYTPTGGNKFYAAPEFVWYGAANGVMWELDSVAGAALIGICLRGRGATAQAGIGLNISQRGGLIGSGLHLLERLTFNDLTVGVKFGEGQTTGAGNCDTTTFRDCTWQSCDTAILLSHQQNLVYSIEGTSGWVGCKQVLRSTAGGYVHIANLNANACGGVTDDAWMLDLAGGRYAGTHKIGMGRLENGSRQLLRTRSRYTEVLIEGLIEAQDNQNVTMVDMTGGQVTFIGGKLSTHNAAAPFFQLHQDTPSGGVPSVRLYGVRFDTADFLYEEWFGHDTNSYPQVTVRDCEDQHGQQIPSFSTRLESGLPVPLRARTTDGATTVTATLRNDGSALRTDNCCAIGPGAYRVRATFIAVTADTHTMQVRAVREMDVTHTGTTLSITTPETIGTDLNPDALTFSVTSVNSFKYLAANVRGKASTTIDWRVEFQLVGGLSQVTTAA